MDLDLDFESDWEMDSKSMSLLELGFDLLVLVWQCVCYQLGILTHLASSAMFIVGELPSFEVELISFVNFCIDIEIFIFRLRVWLLVYLCCARFKFLWLFKKKKKTVKKGFR